MPKRNYNPEQIINSLREAEVLLSQGNTAAELPGTWVSRNRPITNGEGNMVE